MAKTITRSNALGFISLVVATFLFSLFGVFTRIISDKMGIFFQLSTRIAIMIFLLTIIGFFSNSLKKINERDYPMFVFRGFLIICDFASFIVAVNNLSLGLTLFLFYAASVTSNFVYGSVFLHEKITRIKIISLSLAFAGLIFIYAGDFHGIKLIPSIFAIISGACFGLSTSTSKKLTAAYSVIQVNLIAYGVALLLSLLLFFVTKETVNIIIPQNIWLTLIVFSGVSVITICLTLYGFNKIEAQKAGLIMLTELIFVLIMGFVFYEEIPTFNVLLGGVLITISLTLPNLDLSYFKKRFSLLR